MSRVCPSKTTVPLSRGYTPASMFISVDLPAPFSPSSAWTSPFPTEKSTLSSTVTPKNALEILHCSRRQLQRVLSKLCREGFLLRTGKGRYRLNPQPGTEEL